MTHEQRTDAAATAWAEVRRMRASAPGDVPGDTLPALRFDPCAEQEADDEHR